jgi:hypothetical protein
MTTNVTENRGYDGFSTTSLDNYATYADGDFFYAGKTKNIAGTTFTNPLGFVKSLNTRTNINFYGTATSESLTLLPAVAEKESNPEMTPTRFSVSVGTVTSDARGFEKNEFVDTLCPSANNHIKSEKTQCYGYPSSTVDLNENATAFPNINGDCSSSN